MILAFAVAISVSADNPTTIESSTMYFASVESFTLTPDENGYYLGVIPMTEESGGFDVYAREDALAWFGGIVGGEEVWDSITIVDHDWTDWNPDTPDWYAYSLELSYDEESGEYRWAIRNHSGTSAQEPWYLKDPVVLAQGVPMSGVIVWHGNGKGYAYETDVGAYLPPLPPDHGKIPGGAATKGGGSACWDMDWSWGSEVVPLEYPGFEVEVTGTGGYHVTMTPARAHGPIPVTVPMKQTQFQWRTWKTPPDWSAIWYDDIFDPSTYELSGNVLHAEISYQPAVSEEVGTSQVYVYNKKAGHWIMREGTISYFSPHSSLWVTEYWKGYLDFGDEEPSPGTFIHGVQYQWGYVFGYDEDTPPPFYTYAVWDETMGAWLLGFSIYLQDPTDFDQTVAYEGNVPFPDPFIEPVPKSDYNPLGK